MMWCIEKEVVVNIKRNEKNKEDDEEMTRRSMIITTYKIVLVFVVY